MGRRRSGEPPRYCLHRQSGRAFILLNGRQVMLGEYGSAESREAYRRELARWEARGCRALPDAREGLTIADLAEAYLGFVESYYRKGGKPTTEVKNTAGSLAELLALYGGTEAARFRLPDLRTVRSAMVRRPAALLEIDETVEPRRRRRRKERLARANVNTRVGRIIRMFRWGAAEGLVAASVWAELRALPGLRAGRSDAVEPEPVRPVPWQQIAPTLRAAPRPVRGLALLQLCTGARPGELVRMRLQDLDRSGPVWLLEIRDHKTAHHGKRRIIGIGPRGQRVLGAFLRRVPPLGPAEPIFAYAPGEPYTRDSYRRALHRAAKAAGVETFGPHRLRHNCATRLRRELGLEAARTVLGHSSPRMSELYAELDHRRALDVMARLG